MHWQGVLSMGSRIGHTKWFIVHWVLFLPVFPVHKPPHPWQNISDCPANDPGHHGCLDTCPHPNSTWPCFCLASFLLVVLIFYTPSDGACDNDWWWSSFGNPPPAQLTNGGIEMYQLQSDHRRTAIKSCGPHCQWPDPMHAVQGIWCMTSHQQQPWASNPRPWVTINLSRWLWLGVGWSEEGEHRWKCFFSDIYCGTKTGGFQPPLPHRQLTIAECGPKIGKESPVASWLLLLQLHRSSTFKQVFRSWVMTEKSGKLHDFFFPQHATIDQKWAGAVGACPWPTTYSHLPSIHSSALWNMFALHRALWPVSTPMDRSFSHPSPWSWIKPHACLSPCCLCVCVCSARSRRAHRFIFENQHRNMISFLVTFNMGMRWSASAQLGTFSLNLHEDSMYLLI